MRKVAIRVVLVVYALALGITYFIQHPPKWADAVQVQAHAVRTVTLLGHNLTLRLDLEATSRDTVGHQP